MGKKKSKPPVCIEEGCDNRVPPRENWHTMSEDYSREASPYHHRCRKCYARWLCRTEGSKPTKAAKPYKCKGCRGAIQKGDVYNLAFRTAFYHAAYPERVQVCARCVPIPDARKTSEKTGARE